MTPMEMMMHKFEPNSPYLNPVIDLETSAKEARVRLWSWRKLTEVKQENSRVLSRHVRPSKKKSN